MKTTVPVLYIANILVNLNVRVYDKGTLIAQREKIARVYLMKMFWIDIFAASACLTHESLYLLRIFYSNPLLEQMRDSIVLHPRLDAMQ